MAVLTCLLMSNSGEKYHQKCALSTSQINFCAFFIVSYLIKSMVLLLSLKWSWHELPKSCRSQWSLQKVFAFVAAQFRRVTSVLLTEQNIYTIMFPYLPNPTKWRFLFTFIEVLYFYRSTSIVHRWQEKLCYRYLFLTSYKENIIYSSSLLFGFF